MSAVFESGFLSFEAKIESMRKRTRSDVTEHRDVDGKSNRKNWLQPANHTITDIGRISRLALSVCLSFPHRQIHGFINTKRTLTRRQRKEFRFSRKHNICIYTFCPAAYFYSSCQFNAVNEKTRRMAPSKGSRHCWRAIPHAETYDWRCGVLLRPDAARITNAITGKDSWTMQNPELTIGTTRWNKHSLYWFYYVDST